MAEPLADIEPASIPGERFVTMVAVRASGPGLAVAADVLAVALPTTAGTYADYDGTAAIWLGPDEWLVTTTSRTGEELESQLRDVLGPHGGAAVDVSGQRTTLRLSGSRVCDVLAKGCSLDLHPSVFGAGSAAQTMLGQAGIVLLACDGTGTDYRILVRTSFARYLTAWLNDAAAEYVSR